MSRMYTSSATASPIKVGAFCSVIRIDVDSLPAGQLRNPELWQSAGFLNGEWTKGLAAATFPISSENRFSRPERTQN